MHAKVTHVTLLIVIVITIYGYSYTSEFLDSLVIHKYYHKIRIYMEHVNKCNFDIPAKFLIIY